MYIYIEEKDKDLLGPRTSAPTEGSQNRLLGHSKLVTCRKALGIRTRKRRRPPRSARAAQRVSVRGLDAHYVCIYKYIFRYIHIDR